MKKDFLCAPMPAISAAACLRFCSYALVVPGEDLLGEIMAAS